MRGTVQPEMGLFLVIAIIMDMRMEFPKKLTGKAGIVKLYWWAGLNNFANILILDLDKKTAPFSWAVFNQQME